ncbi:metallophosphoesterase [Lactobacillus sp. Sy-1]|uniref:metallophosphoesterase family protein n=1 Tax=Lactobacillus sp. Sy-1 TaxID=2109645 RepID=UPI001C5B76EC|nr:metallophosphoesterase [Lactobacillus sp. Sy-1]MBW1605893.1 metallophosphoesterase [Lactobacillus sp. Sy-1]
MPYKIIQISDSHLHNSNGVKEMLQQFSPNDKLQLVFDDIYKHRLDYNASLIVITGDLIHEGNKLDYKRLRKYLNKQRDRIGVPIFVTLGNHDRTDAFFTGYLNEPAQNHYYYKVGLADYDIYCLDTTFKDLPQGYLDRQQLDWVKKELAASDKPALMFMHHPSAGVVLDNMNFSILQNSEELYDVIRGHRILGIFSGHVHFPASFVRDGVLNVVCDSTAYHIDCRNDHDHLYKDSTSYNIINIDHDNVGVSSVSLVSDNRFSDNVNGHMKIANTNFVDRKMFSKA